MRWSLIALTLLTLASLAEAHGVIRRPIVRRPFVVRERVVAAPVVVRERVIVERPFVRPAIVVAPRLIIH